MLQPFFSVYTKYYRNFEREPEAEALKPCIFYSDLKENFLPAEEIKFHFHEVLNFAFPSAGTSGGVFVPTYNRERDEAIMRELYLKKFITTYQLAYCNTESKNFLNEPNDLDDDQFMRHFTNYFSKKTHPVLRPVDTFRRIFHYSRFDNYYTGKSTYEEDISREGYEFFKKDYDAGISRLFRKTQAAMKKKAEALEEKPPPQAPLERVSSAEQQPAKDKICAICCEKFGDFSYKPTC